MRISSNPIMALVFLTLSCFLIPSLAKATDHQKQIINSAAIWPPFHYVEDNETKGLYRDILHELIEVEMGLSLLFRLRPWKRAQAEVKNGSADLLITIPTVERQGYALISKQPVFQFYFGLYTYRDHPKLNEIMQVKTLQDIIDLDLVAVTNLGNGWHKENIEDKGIRTYVVPSDQNIASVLARGRADIMIDVPPSMNHLIKKHGLSSKLVLTEFVLKPSNMHVMLSKKSKFASRMGDLDKALDRITADGRLARIVERYSGL